MSDISPEVLNTLAAKLDGLDLTDEEQSVLDEILDRAAAYEPEVEGFVAYSGFASGSDLSGTALRLGSGFGAIGGTFGGKVFDPTDPKKP